jgi:hypothetical protein
MTPVIQFLVLKRENNWIVKSGDLERHFSIQREAVDAAIRFANDSGKEGKPGVSWLASSARFLAARLSMRCGGNEA